VPFKKICFEVAGVCNGRCRYCVTGAKNANPGGFIEADAFDATLRDLERLHLIDSRTLVDVFNWGELFLHPDLKGIISVINDHNLRYSISTNASIVPQIDEAFTKNLMSIFLSMCGFSQQSYDRIHKFKFDRITENIATIVSGLRSVGYRKYITILFHVYRFNTEELRECQRFAHDLGVVLIFYDAYLADWWQFEGFIQGTLHNEKRHQILDDLFIDEKRLGSAPEGWRCPEWDVLVIDEWGNVPVCGCLPNNHPSYFLGAVDERLAERLQIRPNLPICKTCIELGIGSRWFHPTFKGDPSTPKWVLRLTMENWRMLPIMMKMSAERFDAKQYLFTRIKPLAGRQS